MRLFFTNFLILILFVLTYTMSSLPNLEHLQTGRQSWPHLTGFEANAAVDAIKKDRPDIAAVHIVPEHSMVTADYRVDRVRVFVDKENKVAKEPRVG